MSTVELLVRVRASAAARRQRPDSGSESWRRGVTTTLTVRAHIRGRRAAAAGPPRRSLPARESVTAPSPSPSPRKKVGGGVLSGRMVPLSAVHSGVSNANGSASTATIAIPGLPKPLRAIHLSDSHTDLGPDAESGSLELCEMMYHCYNDGVGFPGDHNQQLERRGYPLLPLEALAGELEQAADEGVDLVLHTGDLLNFPSPKAGQHAAELLGAGGRPYLFISGNHDWQHSPPLPGAPEDLRNDGRHRALTPLFAGRDHSCWAEDVGGIRFVGVDNSTRYVTRAQLDFFREATADETRPVVLMIHVPLLVPGLLENAMKDGITPLQQRDLCAVPPDDVRPPPTARIQPSSRPDSGCLLRTPQPWSSRRPPDNARRWWLCLLGIFTTRRRSRWPALAGVEPFSTRSMRGATAGAA